jgi:hypothetical protein
MVIMNKNIFVVLLSMLVMSCSSQRSILFEHIGAIDKPISCIIIAKERKTGKTFCDFQEEYVAAGKNFKQIEKYVLSNDTKLNDTGSINSFGSFKVQLNDKILYMIDGQQNAITYFTNLAAKLNSIGDQKLAVIIETNILIRLKGL